ncbi:hypothetical protein EIP91_007609 [Steccherinum ochraceum]|uniref:Peptidase A1 domain-containing protein n=1 Tax=Steccherinum ochraceum TaxID=92696 RepID=A0A4R0RI76_9APHY|nr:hypothetical protein EIP91_007609 [Steccherinum ochraceum]
MRWPSCRLTIVAWTLSALPVILGARFSLTQRDEPPHSTRLNFTNPADPFSFGVEDLDGDGLIFYFVTVKVDGQDFVVSLDTGSSDLWLDASNITFSNNVVSTNQSGAVPYGDGTAAVGPILLSDIAFGEFVIEKQAFISAPGSNATLEGRQGLLGVGPPSSSIVGGQLANTTFDGAPLLSNLFNLYPNESNFITFLLNRTDLGVTGGGSFTVGELDSDFAAVANATKLPVLGQTGFWLTAMDSMIVNGQTVSGGGVLDNTTFPHAKIPAGFEHKLLTVLDTGTALVNGPPSYVDAIYKTIPNASLVASAGTYIIPCDTKLNVSFVFNGTEYPMDPLDAIRVGSNDDGSIVCAGTISYIDEDSLDFILGDSFMRNVYSLFDFGNLTDANDSQPFIQLLSVTDKDQAWADFDTVQRARVASFQAYASNATSTATSTASIVLTTSINPPPTQSAAVQDLAGALAAQDDPTSASDYAILKRNSFIIIGLLAGVLVLLVALIAMQVVKARGQGRKYSPLTHTGRNFHAGDDDEPFTKQYDS